MKPNYFFLFLMLLCSVRMWGEGTYDTIRATACDSYQWGDTTILHSGEYIHIQDADTLILILTINHSTHFDTSATACDSFLWRSMVCDSTGQYIHSYVNSDGYPSTDTLNLTINYCTNILNPASAKVAHPLSGCLSIINKISKKFKDKDDNGNNGENECQQLRELNDELERNIKEKENEVDELRQRISQMEQQLSDCEPKCDTVNNNDKVIEQYIWLVLKVPYNESRCQRAIERYALASEQWQADKVSKSSISAVKKYQSYNSRLITLIKELDAQAESKSYVDGVRNKYLQTTCRDKIMALQKSFEKEGFTKNYYEFLFKVMNQILDNIEKTKNNSSMWVDFDSYIKMLENKY